MTNAYKKLLVIVITGLLIIGGSGSSAVAQEKEKSLGFIPSYLSDLMSFLNRPEDTEEEKIEEEKAQDVYHTVERGETLTSIANTYDVTIGQLVALNNLANPDRLSVGQQLMIELPEELEYTIKGGDTVAALAMAYGAEVENIKRVNEIKDVRALEIGERILIPGPTKLPPPPTATRTVAVASRSTSGQESRVSGAPQFIWPLNGTITSPFGEMRSSGRHMGLDIAARRGTPILAMASGEVLKASRGSSYGLYVILDHGGGWQTLYAHASSLSVKVGQQVSQGQEIAKVGRTGNATGDHVHLEVRRDGERINPRPQLP